ncbi:MAG: sn-glycerol-1-phosphate dehydrogenase [Clostridia bacterium]|nr:sn-glycerol-1-phosphate dehydrogenase [Clostridia bacterium]
MKTDLRSLMAEDGFVCPSCGKRHFGGLSDCLIERGAMERLPSLLEKYHAHKPFILCDRHTYRSAGERTAGILSSAGIAYTVHIVEREKPAPDEHIVGEALMFCPPEANCVIAVGSGVLNDTGKILSRAKRIPDFIVATAPSMDGFASGTSSMERGGLKISLPSKCPDAVIADPDILAAAPVHMIRSGIGDMVAKYVSIAEWRIAALLVGDPFCETVAEIVNDALDTCVKAAPLAVQGDPDAAASVMEGLVVSGLAMNYAGISRPASGMEHYISHILDMRALAFGTPADLHGIQCGIATLVTVRTYEKLAMVRPDCEKALAAVRAFDPDAWTAHLRERLGAGAEAMIAGERREGKYDPAKHAARLEKILAHWDRILAIIGSLPPSEKLEGFLRAIGHPTSFSEIGVSEEDAREAFRMAKDIRDKYVLGRLLWDLGLLDQIH